MKIPEQEFNDFEKRAFLILRFIIEGMSPEQLTKEPYFYEPEEVSFIFRIKSYCYKSMFNKIKAMWEFQNE